MQISLKHISENFFYTQDTYTLTVDSDPGQTSFEGFDVDLDTRLSSVTGNVDL